MSLPPLPTPTGASLPSAQFHVAVVGAGPAGQFAAEYLMAAGIGVDMLDRLPTPWGLVRAGVAPDHPKIKAVSRQFVAIAQHRLFRYFGNVEFGRDVTRDELLSHYDAVVYAVGARSERRLGIPGEDLPGCIAAGDFVGWYNGHPDHTALAPDLSGSRAVVVGNGNVALDVARMLVTPHQELSRTDTADHALAALHDSAIRDVTIIGRRAPADASFTSPELAELRAIHGVDVDVDATEIPTARLEPSAPDSRRLNRNLDLLRGYSQLRIENPEHTLRFRFLRSPIEIRGAGRVEELVVGLTRVETGHDGGRRAVDTGLREVLPADLVIRAVGYRGRPLPGVPFDEVTGTIPNDGAAVLGSDREYVAGWIKRGPSGVIGTNRKDAQETAHRVIADLTRRPSLAGSPAGSRKDADAWLRGRCPDLVDQAAWEAIDRHETAQGALSSRPRIKAVTVPRLLSLARRPPTDSI